VRNCSHKDIEPDERNVSIYLHNAMLSLKQGTFDTYLYRYSEDKAVHIGDVEVILREEAIDRCLFENTNMILKKRDVEPIKVRYALRDTRRFTTYPLDVPFSRVWSFQPSCKVSHDCSIEEDNEDYNTDTFRMEYSQGYLNVYKKRIANLFLTSLAYSYEELHSSITEYTRVFDACLIVALDQMISESYLLKNPRGDTGSLIYIDDMFMFQPDYSNDNTIPYYYRYTHGLTHFPQYTLHRRSMKKAEIPQGPLIYTYDEIKTVYDKILTTPFDSKETEILRLYKVQESSIWGYRKDRLSFQDSLILLYGILYRKTCMIEAVAMIQGYWRKRHGKGVKHKMKGNQSMSFTFPSQYRNMEISLEEQIIPQCISFSNETFRKGDSHLWGIYLYHEYEEDVYMYEWDASMRTLTLANRVDALEIGKVLSNKSATHYKHLWAFMLYTRRHGVTCKVVDPKDKGVQRKKYPPGPGVIVIDPHRVADVSATRIFKDPVSFFQDEFEDYVKKGGLKVLKGQLKVLKHKSLMVEMFLRDKGWCFSQEQMWAKG